MTDHLKVYAGLSIEDGCPMRCYPAGNNEVAFVFGGGHVDDVEVTYGRQSLGEFVKLANAALVEPITNT